MVEELIVDNEGYDDDDDDVDVGYYSGGGCCYHGSGNFDTDLRKVHHLQETTFMSFEADNLYFDQLNIIQLVSNWKWKQKYFSVILLNLARKKLCELRINKVR